MIGNSTSINELVSKMNEADVYSTLCSYLYELKSIPEYTLLSELIYIMDKDSFANMFKYFEGQTIKIPTRSEMKKSLSVLLLYKYYVKDGMKFKEAMNCAGYDPSEIKTAKRLLNKFIEVVEKYNVGNRNY